MGSDLPGEGIEGGWWGESEAKEGRGRKGAFFIGFLEGRRREGASEEQGESAVVVVVDSAGSLFLLESITAQQGQPPS
jgi:hypothetical protein